MADIAISIGRNIGNEPMHYTRWAQFQADLFYDVNVFAHGTVYAANLGRGQWDGNFEDNYVLTATVPDEHVDALRERLKLIRDDYQQEAIALLVGITELL